MRKRRLKAPASWDRAVYDSVSRVVDRRFAFGDEDRVEFIRFMRQYEKFCQVKVLTYCLMSNHFHLQVEVPARSAENLSEDALGQHVCSCFGDAKAQHLCWQLDPCHRNEDEAGARKLLESWLCRIWDISDCKKQVQGAKTSGVFM